MRTAQRGRTPATSRGQATVELALGLPVVLLAILFVAQFALVARDQILVVHAAREAARAAAVNPTGTAAREGALSAGGLERSGIRTRLTTSGGRAHVEVTYRSRTVLPLVGSLVPDPVLRSKASMRIE